jgi:hypothetical protein
MRMKIFFGAIVVLALPFLLAGCEDDLLSSNAGDNELRAGVYTDEAIVLEATDPVEGSGLPGETVFLLQGTPLVADGTLSDLEVSYTTLGYCNIDLWVYGPSDALWKQIAFGRPPEECDDWPEYRHGHLLESLGLNTTELLGEEVKLTISSEPSGEGSTIEGYADQAFSSPAVRAIRFDPDYHTVTRSGPEMFIASAIASEHGYLWIFADDGFAELSLTGEPRRKSRHDVNGAYRIAIGRGSIWSVGGNDLVEFTKDGEETGRWVIPFIELSGVAYGDRTLWIAGRDRVAGNAIVSVDVDSLVSGRVPALMDTLASPGGSCTALAWNERELIVLSDKIYTMRTDGKVLETHELPQVRSMSDITWVANSLWMINRGPSVLASRDRVITRFRLR